MRLYLITYNEGGFLKPVFSWKGSCREKAIIDEMHSRERDGRIAECFIIYFPSGRIYDSALVRYKVKNVYEYREAIPKLRFCKRLLQAVKRGKI